MSLRIAASESLNTDESGQSLTLVVRVYRLSAAQAFLQAPRHVFGEPIDERDTLGDTLIDTQELVLHPGRNKLLSQPWPTEGNYLGVVGLFHRPQPQHWRRLFRVPSGGVRSTFVLGALARGFSHAASELSGAAPASARYKNAGQSSLHAFFSHPQP